MKPSFLLSLFILVFSILSNAQTATIEDQPLDSILSWMQINYSKDSNDFHQIALRTISKGADSRDLKLLGELHESLADWHGYHGLINGDSILVHDYKALAYFKELGDQSAIARVYAAISIDQLNNGDLEKSQEATFKAIELYKELGDEGGLANCYRSLTYLFSTLGELDKSISYGLQAYDYYKKVGDYDRMSYTLLSLIGTYTSNGQLEKA